MKSTRYDVYWNLHRECWSVRKHGGYVEAHAEFVRLVGPITFTVQPAGRRRVLKTKRKNVHAWITGGWAPFRENVPVQQSIGNVGYNPYRDEYFVWTRPPKEPRTLDDGDLAEVWFTINEHGKPVVKGRLNEGS